MNPKQTTLGAFIDLLNPAKDHNRAMWIQYCKDKHGEKSWQKMRETALTKNSVIQLAAIVASVISGQAAQWSEAKQYEDCLKAGRALLHDIHRIATEKGIVVDIKEIDLPIGNKIQPEDNLE